MYKILFVILLTFVGFSACKKEPTTWSPNWATPLIKGKLTIENLLPDNSKTNSDGYGSLVFKDTLYSFRIDTLIKLPDTSLITKSAIAFPAITLSPGNTITNPGIDQLYDLGQIQLKKVIIAEGKGFIEISSPWPGKTKATFIFPKVKDANGIAFEQVYFLEAGSISNPFIVRDTFDLKDYTFDLTGANGDLSNNLTADFLMSSNETSSNFTVTNQDTVLLSLSFAGLKPKYAKGYFGQYDIEDQIDFKFPQVKKLAGAIMIDSVRMDLEIRNGFDIIAQSKINNLIGKNTLTGQSVALNFPLLNQSVNLNPANGGLYNNTPSNYLVSINSFNSNIIPFLVNLPDSLDFGYALTINPFGNIGGGTDQFFPNSRINLMMDAELPLSFSLNNFSLRDTFDVDFDLPKELVSGSISLQYTNLFPIAGTTKLYLLNGTGEVLDSITGDGSIIAANHDPITYLNTASQNIIQYDLSQNQLENLAIANQISFAVTLNSYQNNQVKVNINDYFDFKLISNLNLKLAF
ncbi:hypothetical protein DNU06_06585 [Putridiphycobacter roseus]|uniref:DUF4270 domain-containing protein n=1 Tax=Putridiphycobacter roseus TaxID=2219161 RepID=A0A2W1N1Q7_9FLAO|nr:hypothetical protein [Putridiphycobacter roseus]PZE17490.1 hypothetical protein DNU06_06585 [Putridiphycobacter roseus]